MPILTYANDQFLSYPSSLKTAVEKIYSLQEARHLINLANKEGQIRLAIVNPNKCAFQGLWEASTRTIYVNISKQKNLGLIIQTILFELHNALGNSYFDQLWKSVKNGTLAKSAFIEKAERFEYNNLIKTETVIEKGVKLKIFPPETHLQIIPDFKLHFFYQQLTGHSDWFSKEFDKSFPCSKQKAFRGSLMNLSTLTSEDKNDLIRYIRMCRRMNAESPNNFFDPIEKEYLDLQCCLNGEASENLNCERAERRLELFQQVFKNFF